LYGLCMGIICNKSEICFFFKYRNYCTDNSIKDLNLIPKKFKR